MSLDRRAEDWVLRQDIDSRDGKPLFHGHDDSYCGRGEHRTVGSYRAWCHACSEWCYPSAPCKGCELPLLRAQIDEIRLHHRRILDTEGDFCSCGGNEYPCKTLLILGEEP